MAKIIQIWIAKIIQIWMTKITMAKIIQIWMTKITMTKIIQIWMWDTCISSLLYGQKLLREKTSANFTVLWLFAKVFSTKFGVWHSKVIQKPMIIDGL